MAAWTVTLRAEYVVLRLLDPLIRSMWFSVGIGITSRVTVRGRRTGRERSVLVGLLRVNGACYGSSDPRPRTWSQPAPPCR